jgi:hypothetical protein
MACLPEPQRYVGEFEALTFVTFCKLNFMGGGYGPAFYRIDCVGIVAWSYRSLFAEEAPKQTFTCTAKTFNECLMEAPCSAWKRLGPKGYKLETKIIFRGNPVEGETISGGTMGDILETKCGKK